MATTITDPRLNRRACILSALVFALGGAKFAIPSTSSAGSVGGFGGALEITQVANNVELLMQVSEAMTQTAAQINMVTTMLQNLRSLSGLAAIARKMGIPLDALDAAINVFGGVQGAINAFRNLERSVTRLGQAANQVGDFYGDLLEHGVDVNQDGRIDERDMQIISRTMNVRQRERARQVLASRMDALREMTKQYESVQRQTDRIPEIAGNVQGFQFLAAQNAGMQRLMLNAQAQMKQAQAEMDERRLAEMEQADIDRRLQEKIRADALARNRF